MDLSALHRFSMLLLIGLCDLAVVDLLVFTEALSSLARNDFMSRAMFEAAGGEESAQNSRGIGPSTSFGAASQQICHHLRQNTFGTT